ncbi:hypothetical protein [Micromonospora tulbaghiae]|uniref:hypothetical protein n=1 Tax=Micromonospora tulbaghiae TaxID=479978 RepID=UPI0033CEE895
MADLRVHPPSGLPTSRVLPSPSSSEWNDPQVLSRYLGVDAEFLSGAVPSRDELVAMYGTAVPAELAAMGALDADVAAAERYAADAVSPGVAA